MIDSFGRAPNPADNRPGGSAPFQGGPRAVEGERRVITVLFTDVVNSTSLASHFDPEEWAEIMNEAFHLMINPIREYDGMVARLMGDGLLAFFGAPQAHEDDPQRAVLAGLGIVNGIRSFAVRFQEEYGLVFNVRVGINTGPVVVGEIGSSESLEYTAMGDAINVAARMEQTAAAGTVQISEDTYRLIAPLFDVWDLGGIDVKGKDEPIHAYRVLGLEPQPDRLRNIEGVSSALVGRQRELGRLREVLSGLRDGESRICYLIGEAGLGKSRLIAEIRNDWRDQLAGIYGDINPIWRGWTEFVALSFGASRPYDVLKRQVRQLCGIRDSDPPSVVHERLGALVSVYPADLHERMHRVFGSLLGDNLPDARSATVGESFKTELLDVLLQMARVQADQGPTVYVIDDVHWADESSLDAMRELMPLVREAPILFLFAMRPDWNAPGWQFYLRTQIEYAEFCSSIYLEPLSAEETRTLVTQYLQGTGTPERIHDLIEEKAEGNPLFVEETVRALIDSEALGVDESGALLWRPDADIDRVVSLIGLPGNVQALMTARIDRLDPGVRRTLQLASVIGRSFPLEVLQRLSDDPDGVPKHLELLGQADLVRPIASGPTAEYAFRHALARDAAYETILIRQRRRYHRRVGEVLEALYADRLTEEAPQLAHHFAEGRDWAKAVRYYTQAGDAAASLYANVEAGEHYSKALEIALMAPSAVDDEQLVDLFRKRGRIFEITGRYDDALDNYERLGLLAEERQSPILELESLMPQAVIYSTPTSRMDAELGREMAERALRLAENSGRHDAEARANWSLMLLSMNVTPDLQQAIGYGERALAIAREHKLTEIQAYVLNDIGRAYGLCGRQAESWEALSAARRLWEALGNEPMLSDVLGIMAQGKLLAGELAESEALARDGLAISRRIGSLWGQALNSSSLGYALIEQGNLSQGIWALEASSILATRANFSGPATVVPLVLAWLYLTLGAPRYRHDELEAKLKGLAAEKTLPQAWQLWRVFDLFTAGDHEGAYEQFQAYRLAESLGGRQDTVLIALLLPVIALTAGRPEEALALSDRALAGNEAIGARTLLVDVLLTRARALDALGRAAEAEASYREAIAEAVRQGACRSEWFAHAALADRAADPAVAATHRARAAEIVRFLASQIDEAELRDSFLGVDQVRRVLEPA